MKITSVKVFKNKEVKFGLIGKATICLDEVLWLEAKIREGKNGWFLSFPSESYEKDGEKVYKDMVVMKRELKEMCHNAVKEQMGGDKPTVAKKSEPVNDYDDNEFPF